MEWKDSRDVKGSSWNMNLHFKSVRALHVYCMDHVNGF